VPARFIVLVESIVKTRSAAPEGQDFIISSLPPSLAQRRLALGVALTLMAAFVVTAGPLSTVPLLRIDAFLPMYVAAMFVCDSITALLLFAQFAILRSHALLAISSGYLFSALILIPWILTFPGVFAPGGLLGAGLQSTGWLYILWHAGFPLFVMAYALLKNVDPSKRRWTGARSAAILSSAAVAVAAVCAATLLVTAGEARLPILLLDPVSRADSLHQYVTGCILLVNVVAAFSVLWVRRGSVLDLWLMVVLCDYLLEIAQILIPSVYRYSLGWYAGRIFGLISASLVLFVLLYEITTLYAQLRLLNEELEQRVVERTTELVQASEAQTRAQAELQQARNALGHRQRVSLLGEVAASLAHEIKQPIAAAQIDAKVCRRALSDDRLNLEAAREAADRMFKDAAWADEVIKRTTALYKKDTTHRERVDVNALIREMARLLQQEASAASISIRTTLAEALPNVMADRVQLQQVFMNLMLNAIDAMKDTRGELTVSSQMNGDSDLLIAVRDTGVGLPAANPNQIFESFVTTKPHGTGMGLAITRSIVESHGGRLWATANSGPGATFLFTLLGDAGEPLESRPR
jgi:signal transduction histidine kinase